MDVLLNDDERQVRDEARSFLQDACPPSLVRAVEADHASFAALWTRVVELGWIETCLAETSGGIGLPLPYLVLLFEEVGRHLAPVPLLSVAVSTLVLERYGTPAQAALLDRVRAGETILSFAFQEEDGAWSADAIRTEGRVEGDELVLDGAKMFVDDLAISEFCLVAFRTPDRGAGLSLAVVPTAAAGLDRVDLVATAKDGQSAARLRGVRIPLAAVVGELGRADRTVADAMDLAALFGTARMVGAARKATELAVAYAKERSAFEQPLGSFQAVQHLCADMLIGVDGAELLCREAAWKLGQGLDAGVEISQAKAFANEKCVAACRSAQQIHGGMGFIMEFDLQLWYRRVASWSLRHGTTAEHRGRVADHLLGQGGKIRLDRPVPA